MSRAGRLLPGLVGGLLPVVWIPVSIDSFILPRIALTLTAAGVLIALGLVRPRRSLGALRWPVLAVVVAAVVAAVFSVAPSLSLVGDYSRYESLPVRLAYVGLFVGAAWLAEPEATVTGFLLGCGVAAVETCYQGFFVDAFNRFWLGCGSPPVQACLQGLSGPMGPLPRPDGNLGQPNLLGALLAMAIPLTLDRARRDWRWLPLGALLAVALVLSASRSGWLGAVAGGAVLAIWAVPARWRLPAAVAGGVVLAASLSAILLTPLRDLNQDTGSARLGVWGDALRLIAARPLTGWGEDTTGLVFGHFQSADWQTGTRFDRAHSMPLDLLATQGVLGLLACTWLFGSVWLRLWRRPALAGLAGALAAYLVSVLLNFDWAPATAPLWLLAGCAAGAWGEDRVPVRPPPWRVGVGAAGILVALALAVPPQVADIAAYYGRNDVAIRFDPLQPRYWSSLGGLDAWRRAAALGSTDPGTYVSLGDAEAAAGHPAAARAAYRQALAIYPYETDARTHLHHLTTGK